MAINISAFSTNPRSPHPTTQAIWAPQVIAQQGNRCIDQKKAYDCSVKRCGFKSSQIKQVFTMFITSYTQSAP
ncbi:hypothetical protein AAFF_G00357180 [Aldrovandia affinis]|uniref:Uncharacterized protein n=1 Tax=Aldrovandia affinis TaxID=143900 RepID=A0AAD7X152_9TELE|nr:hypothetical protein AAFF_G00357180 [Aldrovandia affinis]